MNTTDRRAALQTLAIAALAPIGAVGLGAPPAHAAAPLSIPTAPVVLRRTLERALGDGAVLSVTRAWECRFSRDERGIVVQGRQIDVMVLAPPSLAELAGIERQRDASELFPARIDDQGRLMQNAKAASSSDVLSAIEVAVAMVERSALPPDSSADAKQFLMRLSATAAEFVSAVRQDLFYPVVGISAVSKELPLPRGGSGYLDVEMSARAQASGLLECVEKRIVTRIGDSARMARECWELGPA